MASPLQPRATPFLMFEGRAEEAMRFYVSLFDDGEILSLNTYGPGEVGAAGSVQLARFTVAGQTLMCIDSPASHGFSFTPSISLYVDCRDEAEIDRLYGALVDGGQALMGLANHGFSTKFGWVNDRFGVSWQLNLD